MAKGQFDMNDLRSQLRQMQKMGGLGMLAGMLPGMKKAKAAMQQRAWTTGCCAWTRSSVR
jgi:signal recognition particle subunit SRP54